MAWVVAVFGGFWLFGAINWGGNGERLSQHALVQAVIGTVLIVAALIAHVLERR